MEKTNQLNVIKVKLNDCISHLMTNQVSSDMYAISYEPCITSFVPPYMYAELIDDTFPNKTKFLNSIENRLQELSLTNKKYALFNVESINDFSKNGKNKYISLAIFYH